MKNRGLNEGLIKRVVEVKGDEKLSEDRRHKKVFLDSEGSEARMPLKLLIFQSVDSGHRKRDEIRQVGEK